MGTAGLTAMLAILALEDHGLECGAGLPVMVTGASGGVGWAATAILATLGQMGYGTSVAAVGLTGGTDLPAKVTPFLLRGVNLLGIDSVLQPYDNRVRAWRRIVRDLALDKPEARVTEAGLGICPGSGRIS